MNFKVLLSSSVTKRLDSLDRPTERRIRDRIREIANDPYDTRVSKPLAYPKGYRSSRVGDWRIIFVVDTKSSGVEILSVESRGQVYRTL